MHKQNNTVAICENVNRLQIIRRANNSSPIDFPTGSQHFPSRDDVNDTKGLTHGWKSRKFAAIFAEKLALSPRSNVCQVVQLNNATFNEWFVCCVMKVQIDDLWCNYNVCVCMCLIFKKKFWKKKRYFHFERLFIVLSFALLVYLTVI